MRGGGWILSDIKLFNEGERSSTSSKKNEESSYEYINESTDESIEIVRKLLELWFSYYPETSDDSEKVKKDLIGNFRNTSSDKIWSSQITLGAFIELLLHEFLIGLQCKIKVKPESDKQNPDFFVTTENGEQFYLEARSMTFLSREDAMILKCRTRLDEIINENEKIRSKRIALTRNYSGKSIAKLLNNTNALDDLLNKVIIWLEEISEDYDNLIYPRNRVKYNNSLYEDLEIEFSYPRMRRENQDVITIFDVSNSQIGSNPYEIVIKNLICKKDGKAVKYKDFINNQNKPYIIALNVAPYSFIEQAITGLYLEEIKKIINHLFYKNDQCKSVSGILLGSYIGPVTATIKTEFSKLSFIKNTNAQRPAPDIFKNLPQYYIEDGEIKSKDGEHFSKYLRLEVQ
jgi:hypothetical protein